MNFFGMVKDKVTSNDIYRRELIIHLLRYLYLELFNAYEKEASLMTTRKDTRKEELANKFFGLINEALARRIRMLLSMLISCVSHPNT